MFSSALCLTVVLFFFTACIGEEVKPHTEEKIIAARLLHTPVDSNHVKASIRTIPIDSTISIDFLMGKFTPSKHPDFVLIPQKYASRAGMYMHREAFDAFKRMADAAQKQGIILQIKSAARNYQKQKQIWNDKWNGKRLLEGNYNAAKLYPLAKKRAIKILEYSSMPGTSRHHWGTDIDLNAFTNSYFEKGKGLQEYLWLTKHAKDYGFCQPYTAKGKSRPYGYNEEKWHWSYTPLSRKFTQQYTTRISNKDIKGFDGADTVSEIDIIQKYVLGIAEDCL